MMPFKSSALAAAAAALAWASPGLATAGGLDLSAVIDGDHAVITLSVGSIGDLFATIDLLSEDPDAAAAVHGDGVLGLGLTFAFDGGWASSPLRAGSIVAPSGPSTSEGVADAGKAFGLNMLFDAKPALVDGIELVKFDVDLPSGSGVLRLISANLNPHTVTVSNGSLADAAGLASVTVAAVVPEPSTYLMMLLGVAGVGMLAARRRQRA